MPTPSEEFSDIGEFQPGEAGWWYGKPGDHKGLKKTLQDLGIDMILRTTSDNLGNWTPETGAAIYAEDEEQLYLGDGDQWNAQATWGRSPAYDSVEAGDYRANDKALRAALDDYVVPVGPSIGLADAVAVDSSSNPVQDVYDKFDAENATGKIILPPEVHAETQINPVNGVSLEGNSVRGSQIIWDNDTPGLRFKNDAGDMSIDRVRLVGPGIATSTSPAIAYASSSNNIHWGQVAIENWGQAVKSKWSSPFQIKHDHLQIGNCDAGDKDALIDWGNSHPPVKFDYITAYPRKERTGSPSTILRVGGDGDGAPAVQVGCMNLGTSAKEAVKVNFSNGFHVGHIHYECPYQGMVPKSLVKLRRVRGNPSVGSFFLHHGDCEHVVEAYSDPHVEIGRIGTGVEENYSIQNSKVLVHNGGNPMTGVVEYHGPSSDITTSGINGEDRGRVRSKVDGPLEHASGTFTHTTGGPTTKRISTVSYNEALPVRVVVSDSTTHNLDCKWGYDWFRRINAGVLDIEIKATWQNEASQGIDLDYKILPVR